jgi:hypothetical protein
LRWESLAEHSVWDHDFHFPLQVHERHHADIGDPGILHPLASTQKFGRALPKTGVGQGQAHLFSSREHSKGNRWDGAAGASRLIGCRGHGFP